MATKGKDRHSSGKNGRKSKVKAKIKPQLDRRYNSGLSSVSSDPGFRRIFEEDEKNRSGKPEDEDRPWNLPDKSGRERLCVYGELLAEGKGKPHWFGEYWIEHIELLLYRAGRREKPVFIYLRRGRIQIHTTRDYWQVLVCAGQSLSDLKKEVIAYWKEFADRTIGPKVTFDAAHKKLFHEAGKNAKKELPWSGPFGGRE